MRAVGEPLPLGRVAGAPRRHHLLLPDAALALLDFLEPSGAVSPPLVWQLSRLLALTFASTMPLSDTVTLPFKPDAVAASADGAVYITSTGVAEAVNFAAPVPTVYCLRNGALTHRLTSHLSGGELVQPAGAALLTSLPVCYDPHHDFVCVLHTIRQEVIMFNSTLDTVTGRISRGTTTLGDAVSEFDDTDFTDLCSVRYDRRTREYLLVGTPCHDGFFVVSAQVAGATNALTTSFSGDSYLSSSEEGARKYRLDAVMSFLNLSTGMLDVAPLTHQRPATANDLRYAAVGTGYVAVVTRGGDVLWHTRFRDAATVSICPLSRRIIVPAQSRRLLLALDDDGAEVQAMSPCSDAPVQTPFAATVDTMGRWYLCDVERSVLHVLV